MNTNLNDKLNNYNNINDESKEFNEYNYIL